MLLSSCKFNPSATILIRLSKHFCRNYVSTFEWVKFILVESFNTMKPADQWHFSWASNLNEDAISFDASYGSGD